jgi:hypothetical protein
MTILKTVLNIPKGKIDEGSIIIDPIKNEWQ